MGIKRKKKNEKQTAMSSKPYFKSIFKMAPEEWLHQCEYLLLLQETRFKLH